MKQLEHAHGDSLGTQCSYLTVQTNNIHMLPFSKQTIKTHIAQVLALEFDLIHFLPKIFKKIIISLISVERLSGYGIDILDSISKCVWFATCFYSRCDDFGHLHCKKSNTGLIWQLAHPLSLNTGAPGHLAVNICPQRGLTATGGTDWII